MIRKKDDILSGTDFSKLDIKICYFITLLKTKGFFLFWNFWRENW
jgi:hypothetical protein